MDYARVVVIGGGFAGLNVAKSLKKAKVQLTLLDKSNHHLFQPLLYQVATAALSPAEIAYPIREVFRRQKNAMVVMGDATSIDKENKRVILGNGDFIEYDYLVIATGARHSYFGNDHWERLAPGLKTISDALKIREHVLMSFEKAERINDLEESSKYLNFVIIGGGPTGVEMAGAIAEIAKTTLSGNFRRILPEDSRIFLIEGLPHILPVYSEKLSLSAKKDLEHLGVQVITGKKVTDITEEGVLVEDLFIESKNVIWAAGNQASPLLKTLDVPLDRQGRAIVNSDLTIPNHPEIFVIGDATHAKDIDGNPLPGTATVAIQQGRYVANILRDLIPQPERLPFRYFDKGSMATIGKGKAIAAIGSLEFTGLLAWLMWGLIHVAYLIGFRTKLGVLSEWIIVFFTGQRGVRIITKNIEPELPNKNP
jgi:NADH:ubiquinone reductase (H+-translocating)